MVKKSGDEASVARGAYPSYVLFEEQDGLWWLRGKDLSRAKRILDLEYTGDALGFESSVASEYARRLNKQGIKVGLLRGNTVRTLQIHRFKNPNQVPGTTIGLAPELILGLRELEHLEKSLTRKHSRVRDLVERMRSELSNPQADPLADIGTVYVYKVSDRDYEVDWELTTLPQAVFEAVAVATHQTGRMLRCQLVQPKGRRRHPGRLPYKSQVEVSEPVTYGQLRFEI